MKIKANGIEMKYELSGQGKTLVLIHGFTDNLNMWYNQVLEFFKHYQVLTYDVRGFGQTEKAVGPYSMDMFAVDLHELLLALGLSRACVLGYSMGGRIALEFCLKFPLEATGLVMANSVVGAPITPEREERTKMMIEMIQGGNNDLISEVMTVNSFSPGFKEKDPTVFNQYKAIKLQNDPAGYLPVMMAMGAAAQTAVDLDRIQCPVLILAGTADMFMPLNVAEEMQKKIKGAVLKTFPTGHIAAIEAPKDFNEAVLGFLNKTQ
ncbi:MAG: alpha/beta hydrolase [Deltaproteobacteria bacterium]|nr:alpha/beta hydrolase [Deltaproteobacteria bacterium]